MNTQQLTTSIAVAAGIAIVALFFFIGPNIFTPNVQLPGTQSAAVANSQPINLTVQDEQVGTGDVAKAGDQVTVNYIGKLTNGTVFDTSIGKQPFSFTLGTGQVIPGWDQGLQGMKVGGKRLLIIPPSLAYGAQQTGPIPPNSTLVFEVDLLNVTPPSVGPAH
jgi:FKBP-type peptidyl-prolyl cis-trans isomerase